MLNTEDGALSTQIASPIRVSLYDQLTERQKEKYHYLLPTIGDVDSTAKLVSLIKPRGTNSWPNVLGKIDQLVTASPNEMQYNNALYEQFQINQRYTFNEIIEIVSEVRRELHLAPYLNSLKASCESDFNRLFIVHNEYKMVVEDGKTKKLFLGVVAVFALRIEE